MGKPLGDKYRVPCFDVKGRELKKGDTVEVFFGDQRVIARVSYCTAGRIYMVTPEKRCLSIKLTANDKYLSAVKIND